MLVHRYTGQNVQILHTIFSMSFDSVHIGIIMGNYHPNGQKAKSQKRKKFPQIYSNLSNIHQWVSIYSHTLSTLIPSSPLQTHSLFPSFSCNCCSTLSNAPGSIKSTPPPNASTSSTSLLGPTNHFLAVINHTAFEKIAIMPTATTV